MYRLEVKSGKKGTAGQHSRYLGREGHFAYISREGAFKSRDDLEMTESGNMPAWAKDNPTMFWDMADRHERANGRTYTEVVFALPRELNAEQRVELVREFVQNVLGDRHAYSWAMHAPEASDGLEQPHVHLMFTERINDGIERDPEQFFKRYNGKEPEKGGAGKDRYFSGRQFVRDIREEWAMTANHFMSRHGVEVRIDHRSYKTLGIELEPSQKVGIAKYAGERVAMAEVLAQNREIARRNGERLLTNPAIGVHALTTLNSLFSRRDVEQFVFRNTDGEEQFRAVYAKLMTSPELTALSVPGKEGEWFTSAELRAVETRLVDRAGSMAGTETGIVFDRSMTEAVRSQRKFNAGQAAAFDLLAGDAQLAVVNGAAGTGKSYVLSAVREAAEQSEFQVLGAALQGKTADDMQRDAGISSRTLASFLSGLERGTVQLDERSLVVIDEAGMVGSRQLDKLLFHIASSGARIRLVGDAFQLHAVDAGDAFRAVSREAEQAGVLASLTEIVRQKEVWQREASVSLSRHEIGAALDAYHARGQIVLYESLDAARDALVRQALADRQARPDESQILLAHTNAQRTRINHAVRSALFESGELGVDQVVRLAVDEPNGPPSFREMSLAAGERIMFGRNEYVMNVKNGTLGTIERIESRAHDGQAGKGLGPLLHVRLDDGRRLAVDPSRYGSIDYGYALTIHKSQGVTVDRSYLLATQSLTAELAYVGMTRHRHGLVVASGKSEFADIGAMKRGLSRVDEKDFSGHYAPRAHDRTETGKRQTLADRRVIQTGTMKYVPVDGRQDKAALGRSRSGLDRFGPQFAHTVRYLREGDDRARRALIELAGEARAATLIAQARERLGLTEPDGVRSAERPAEVDTRRFSELNEAEKQTRRETFMAEQRLMANVSERALEQVRETEPEAKKESVSPAVAKLQAEVQRVKQAKPSLMMVSDTQRQQLWDELTVYARVRNDLMRGGMRSWFSSRQSLEDRLSESSRRLDRIVPGATEMLENALRKNVSALMERQPHYALANIISSRVNDRAAAWNKEYKEAVKYRDLQIRNEEQDKRVAEIERARALGIDVSRSKEDRSRGRDRGGYGRGE